MSQDAVLQVKNLVYSYQEGNQALNGISLEFHPGDRVALLGPNGAGKSTFFLCLNGVIEPDGGTVMLCGEEIGKKNRNLLRRQVGIVFQEADSQIIAPTVQAEVSFGPMNLKLPREEVERRTKKAISSMNLDGMERRASHYLSGGEKKRVTIADILAMESRVLLFDEPTASLDQVNQAMLEEVLLRFWEEGKILVVSTHDVEFAYRFANRVIVFSAGQILADGAPEEVFKREDILKSAGVKKPLLWDVWELLSEKHVTQKGKPYPKTVEELSRLLEKKGGINV